MNGQSRLGIYCGKVIEAGWLSAAVITPLFFNIYSTGVFEPDKAILLRTLACIMAAAWVIRYLENSGSPFGRSLIDFLKTPLVIPVFFFITSYCVSALFSLMPGISFRGSWWRMQGVFTMVAYMVIFFLLLREMHDRRQLERLILTVIMTSIPVALFACMQHVGLDPLHWSKDVEFRPTSSLGNAIFLGSYMIMVLFLTAGKLVSCFVGMRKQAEYRPASVILCALYGVIIVLQSAAVIYSGSRGPWIGAGAGLFFAGLLAFKQWRWSLLSWLIAGLIIGGFIVELNRPGSPLSSLYGNVYLKRLGKTYRDVASGGSSANVRLYIWQSAARLSAPHRPVMYPDGKGDRFNPVRPLIGHGPEVAYAAFNQCYPVELGRIKRTPKLPSVDRCHNDIFDSLVTTGLLGLIASQFILITLFSYGLKQLGMMQGRHDRLIFVLLWIGLGFTGFICAVLLVGPEMTGLGLSVGIAAGICTHLVIARGFTERRLFDAGIVDSSQAILVASLLAALFSHFIEIQTGMEIVATRYLFWIYAAIIVVSGLKKSSLGVSRGSNGSAAGYAIVVIIILMTLFYGFGVGFSFMGDSDVLFSNVPAVSTGQPPGMPWAVLWLIVAVGVLCCLLGFIELQGYLVLRNLRRDFRSVLICLLVAFSGIMLFALILSVHLGKAAQIKAVGCEAIVAAHTYLSINIVIFVGFLFLFIISAAWFFMREQETAGLPLYRNRKTVLLVPVLVLAGIFTISASVNQIRAHTFNKQGKHYEGNHLWQPAIALYKRAVRLDTSNYMHYWFLGNGLLYKAQTLSAGSTTKKAEDVDARDILSQSDCKTGGLSGEGLLTAARAVLSAGRDLAPLDTNLTASLARLYKTRAMLRRDPKRKQAPIGEMNRYYQQAVVLSPFNFLLLNEWALESMKAGGDFHFIKEKLDRSMELHPRYYRTFEILGDLYLLYHMPEESLASYRHALDLSHYEIDVSRIGKKIDVIFKAWDD
jgi:O-antigen ligase